MIVVPPYDSNGNVKPHNNAQIKDSDDIIRRIPQYWIKQDLDGNKYINSLAYQPYNAEGAGMSVDLKQLIEADGKNAKEFVTTPKWIGSILFKVGDVRKIGAGYQVGNDPLKENPGTGEPGNPYHCEVWGKFSKPDIRELKKLPIWFVQILDVEISRP